MEHTPRLNLSDLGGFQFVAVLGQSARQDATLSVGA